MVRFAFVLTLAGCLWTLGVGSIQFSTADPSVRAARIQQSADSLLLDQYPGAYAAYSLRRLRADYDGPAVRVRRSSDNAEKDFGFTNSGNLNVSAIENWLGNSNGTVVAWYSQVEGMDNLTGSPGPEIASEGAVHIDADGKPRLYLETGGLSASASILPQDVTVSLVVEVLSTPSGFETFFQINNQNHFRIYPTGDSKWWVVPGDGGKANIPEGKHIYTVASSDSGVELYRNDEQVLSEDKTLGDSETGPISLGSRDAYISELTLYPHVNEKGIFGRYDLMNPYWKAGPPGTNREALLPQRAQWQVTLYDWMESISTEDVTLPSGTLSYDNSYSDNDELADLWMQVEGLTASSVTRAEPEWYTLDAGNGKGIEATGVIRANHDPKGGSYGGNPPRSWQNEPAYWYQLALPLSEGGQGNPWYQNSAMGRRAMIVSSVDLMMHQALNEVESFNWFDMKGKAFLGMAEAYRWAGEVMPSDVQDAYETGMEKVVDDLTAQGPRAVNTNMDMFALHGAADLYMATDDPELQEKCVGLVKRALFGSPDGSLGADHQVFKAGDGYDGGVFNPSGFIMEGDQPDNFYQGESILQLQGALAAVTDQSTGEVDPEWQFMEEVVKRTLEWRSYQVFYDPANDSPYREQNAPLVSGAGYAGRTGSGASAGQADKAYKHLFSADKFGVEQAHVQQFVEEKLPSTSDMESDISGKLSSMNSRMSSNYTSEPPNEWSGWSPWTKSNPYLPEEGWYSTLRSLKNNDDPALKYPSRREGNVWNKAFGGPPLGKEYWSYKNEDTNGREFGFFVEASARQGGYGGWYGGKIETFWIEEVGVVLINRHGKTGCDRSNRTDDNFEDSVCWFNLDWKAGHHVWGRDENGNGFTTLLLRGRELQRTSSFDTDGSPPTVTVNNVFNDPSLSETTGKSGEQTGSEIEGDFEVENTFEVQTNGLKVTHALRSDEADQVNELWATFPVHLRQFSEFAGPDPQIDMNPTSIEYWDGSAWQTMPEDIDNDDAPEMVSTSALRLGRKYPIYDRKKYAYVSFLSQQSLRLAKKEYHDPYQTPTSVRTVHIDLHGDPGTTKTLPASKSVSYTVQTTNPTLVETPSTRQNISLQEGGNLVSTFVVPTEPAMDSVFAGLQSEIAVVENEAGEQYRPSKDINEIGYWNSEEAYRVYTESDITLTIEGDSLGSPSIPLNEGWNWVPYFHPSPSSVDEAVSSVIEDLVLMKDETGRAYFPDKGIEVLEKMEPGEGYKIYVNQSTTLNYPSNDN